MTPQRFVLLLAASLALSAVPVPARAQPAAPARDPAAADALFGAAQEALDKGDWAAACVRFEASMLLDPAVSTLINIAKCREHKGKLATAYAELRRALVLNQETANAKRKKDLEAYAKRLLAALEPRLPRLTIVLRERPAGLRLTRDGEDVPAAVLGEALPVDPGAHTIEASAPGYRSEKRTLELAEGKSASVELALVAEAPAPPPVVVAPAPSMVAVAPAPPPPQPSRGLSPLVYAGFGLGGAGLIIGAITGGLTLAKTSSLKRDQCSKDGTCPPGSLAAASTLAKVSDVSFGVGIAGVVAGVVGLVISRPGAKPAVGAARIEPILGPGVIGVQGAL